MGLCVGFLMTIHYLCILLGILGLMILLLYFVFRSNRGGQISIINYYENWDEGAAHYCDWLNKQKYRFGSHIFPHDARKRDIGAKTQYLDYVTPLLEGKFVVLDIKECDKLEGIQTVRSMLSRCVFDEEKTLKDLSILKHIRKCGTIGWVAIKIPSP